MLRRNWHLPGLMLGTACLVLLIYGLTVLRLSRGLEERVRETIIGRDAAVLHPVVERELHHRAANLGQSPAASDVLAVVLEAARQEGMIAVSAFDADGGVLFAAPETLLVADLPFADYTQLLKGKPISRFHSQLPLHRYFTAMDPAAQAPVLEILLPLQDAAGELMGFGQYYLDGRALDAELTATRRRVRAQTTATLGIGAALIGLVIGGGYIALRRADRLIRERNERLTRANAELTLAAKASAVGQITAHLLHGLQGSVAGLQAAVGGRGSSGAVPDWETAAAYTERMQTMISETVDLLGDRALETTYEISGYEVNQLIRRRHEAGARRAGVILRVEGGFADTLDGHRAGLLCLIVSNLVENAIQASPAGATVWVTLSRPTDGVVASVTDEGPGLAPEVQSHLFEPGRSGRPGGSGLGLAISQLIARQLGTEVELVSTGPQGTHFRVPLPLRRTTDQSD